MSRQMTEAEAREWVLAEMEADPSDQNTPDDDDLIAAWAALYGRQPDDDDVERGLWTDCVNAVESEDEPGCRNP